ncbi:MAG: hypothetical protein QNJ62_08140 [Methyloceanibacter sp.]|nr:hypothetical protein [Methyloceanibacter sp.]
MKVIGATLGATFSALMLWALKDGAGLSIGEGTQVAITSLVTFVAGYAIPPAPRDAVALKQTDPHNCGLATSCSPPSVIPKQRIRLALSKRSERTTSH